ncbi:MAG: response regulator transcription factor [Bacteroidetes bacterium]|nr:response regulator transcription factor [Bacteroidota bacterium]
MKINAVVIDDEGPAISVLTTMLREFCSDRINLIGTANSVASGIHLLKAKKPQLLFLDINMIDGYGFDILKHHFEFKFEVIFITAYNDFAIKAFKYAALHYLLKPVNPDLLLDAIDRYYDKHPTNADQLSTLEKSFTAKPKTIVLPNLKGYKAYELDLLISFSAESGYTLAKFSNTQTLVLTESLNHYQDILDPNAFCRIHSKHLVNIGHVLKYVSDGRNGHVVLSNGEMAEVSTRKKEAFLQKFKTFSK